MIASVRRHKERPKNREVRREKDAAPGAQQFQTLEDLSTSPCSWASESVSSTLLKGIFLHESYQSTSLSSKYSALEVFNL